MDSDFSSVPRAQFYIRLLEPAKEGRVYCTNCGGWFKWLKTSDLNYLNNMDLQRKKKNHSNHFHEKKADLNDVKTRGGQENAQREMNENTSYGGLIDKLHNLDVTLSRNLSFCADKASGRWRTLMIILEISGHGVPWIAGTVISILIFSDFKQEFACNLLVALIIDLAVVGTLKVAVRRKRPVYNEMDMFATVSVDNYSFPSGHSTRAAMVAGLFAVFVSKGIWRVLIGCWALCVSSSRVILGRHHVSDVLCGVVIGLLQAWTVYVIWLPVNTCQEFLTLVPYYGELRNQVAYTEL